MTISLPPNVVARVQRLQAQLVRFPQPLGSLTAEDVLFMALVHGLDDLEDRLRQEVVHGTKSLRFGDDHG